MLSGQTLFLIMVVVGMVSLPLALLWVVIDAWFEERRLARLDLKLAVGPPRSPVRAAPRHAH
jgi:hypothetical protein